MAEASECDFPRTGVECESTVFRDLLPYSHYFRIIYLTILILELPLGLYLLKKQVTWSKQSTGRYLDWTVVFMLCVFISHLSLIGMYILKAGLEFPLTDPSGLGYISYIFYAFIWYSGVFGTTALQMSFRAILLKINHQRISNTKLSTGILSINTLILIASFITMANVEDTKTYFIIVNTMYDASFILLMAFSFLTSREIQRHLSRVGQISKKAAEFNKRLSICANGAYFKVVTESIPYVLILVPSGLARKEPIFTIFLLYGVGFLIISYPLGYLLVWKNRMEKTKTKKINSKQTPIQSGISVEENLEDRL